MCQVTSPRFIDFTASMTARAERMPRAGMAEAAADLSELIARDDWLPQPFRQEAEDHYRQYLLFKSTSPPLSIVSFVWGPGQSTPVHNHGVWGLVGVLQGAEIEERYTREAGQLRKFGDEHRIDQGKVSTLLPGKDIHRVRNAFDDRVSISIHVYGADIGTLRRVFYDEAGVAQPFVSGYSQASERLPARS